MTSILWPVSRGERVEIAPLRSTALREAITRPAASVGVQIEGVLVERLLHDAGEEPGALSLLQETMVLLWERDAPPLDRLGVRGPGRART